MASSRLVSIAGCGCVTRATALHSYQRFPRVRPG